MSEATSTILLKGGTLLVHTATTPPKVEALKNTDLLITDSTISQIGPDLAPPDRHTQVIDCTRKIISPGFIDTHHHVWQTQLKGRHTDDTLLDYHPKGNLQYYNYTPSDIFWGELGGLLEALDAGTTCVVDHAHMTKTPEHATAGLDATLAAGIRSVFCYSLVPQIARWDREGYELAAQAVPEWFLPGLDALSARVAHDGSDGRVTLGLGFDSFHLPKQQVVDVVTQARVRGARVVTAHWRRNNIAGTQLAVPTALAEYGLLGPDIILSHASGSSDEEFKLLKDAGAYVSTTPGTETQMAHGNMVAFRDDVLGSLGVDCQSNNPGSILHAMHIGLATARAQRNAEVLAGGKFPRNITPTTVDAFNLATINGARAVGMPDKLGSLAVGKQADIVVFGTNSPTMACAAEYDPLAAVVRHAGPQEVETVIVAGRLLKREGRLVKSAVLTPLTGWSGCEEVNALVQYGGLAWGQVEEQLRRSCAEIQQRIDRCSIGAAREKVLEQWGAQNGDQVLV